MPLPLRSACAPVSRDSCASLADHAIELLLEIGDLVLERVLALAEHLRLLNAIGAGLRQLACIVGDVLLLLRDLRGLALRISHVALAARGLVALQLPLRLAQPIGGGGRLPGRRRIALRRGAAHRIGRVAQLARGVGEVLAVLIARQFLELARRFLGLLGQRALQVAAVAAGRLARRQAALRSISCSWRRASSFSFSASSSIC